MWQGADHQPSYSRKREKRKDSKAGRRVELFMLLLLVLLLLFYFPHSLLTDVPFGNVFGDDFLPSSSSYLSCKSSFFSPSPASISGENSVVECVISCSGRLGWISGAPQSHQCPSPNPSPPQVQDIPIPPRLSRQTTAGTQIINCTFPRETQTCII